jgi:hypothetical protein
MDTKLEVAEKDSLQRFLIDWNGFPFPNPTFPKIVEFITPLDWALAVAYQHVEKNSSGGKLPQIIIVDRYSYRYPGSFAVEMRRALVEALGGYLEFYSAFGRDTEDQDPTNLFKRLRQYSERVSEAKDALSAADELTAKTPLLALVPQFHVPRQGQLRALRQAWIGYTVQSRDHHDLNNIIGPLALAESLIDDDVPWRKANQADRALFEMAKQLSLVEFDSSIDKSGWAKKGPLETLAKKEEPISIIMIDDQAIRWSGFLRASLSAENIQISEFSDPNLVLERLSNISMQKPFERCLVQSEGQPPRDELLFLDLRFFPAGSSREREFFAAVCDSILDLNFDWKWQTDPHFRNERISERDRKLLSIAAFTPAGPLANLPGMKLPFLVAARRVLQCDLIPWDTIQNSPLYDCFLTLFPRLLAQILYTTPIVLFSSTGRRDLTEHFKHYGNIITSFEKPRLPVHHQQIVRTLRVAIGEATRLIRARRLLRSLSGLALKDVSTSAERPKKDKFYHVEVFIDEHFPDTPNDSRHVWIGGFYAIYEGDSREQAIQKANQFDDSLIMHGFSYYTRFPYLPQLPSGMAVKKKASSGISELLSTLKGDAKPFQKGLVRIKYDARSSLGANTSSGDDVFRRALTTLIETFSYEAMTHYFSDVPPTNVSFSAFSGTRVVPKPDVEARTIGYRWGIEVEGQGADVRLKTVERTALYSILNDIKEFRTEKWQVIRAVAVRMIYDQDYGRVSHQKNGYAICTHCNTVHSLNMQKGSTSIQMQQINECPICKNSDGLRPDYPGGLYIADQVLNRDFSTHPLNAISGPIDFDDELDDGLLRAINAGRAADAYDKVTAASEAAVAWEVAKEGKGLTPLRKAILGRLTPIYADMTGDEILRFSDSLPIRVVLSGFDRTMSIDDVQLTVQKLSETNMFMKGIVGIVAGKSRNTGSITCKVFCDRHIAEQLVASVLVADHDALPWGSALVQ